MAWLVAQWPRLGACVLAVAALFMPALKGVAPVLEPAQWRVADLAAEAVHTLRPNSAPPANPGQPRLSDILRQSRSLWQDFGGNGRRNSASLAWGLALAALIPATALLAGACACLSWIWLLGRWRRAFAIGAAVGLAAAAYAVVASWWLTRLLHSEQARLLTRLQHSLQGLLGARIAHGVQAGLAGPVGLTSEAGLYVLLLSFLAMLMWPLDAPHA